jgi:hypothetical protein
MIQYDLYEDNKMEYILTEEEYQEYQSLKLQNTIYKKHKENIANESAVECLMNNVIKSNETITKEKFCDNGWKIFELMRNKLTPEENDQAITRSQLESLGAFDHLKN